MSSCFCTMIGSQLTYFLLRPILAWDIVFVIMRVGKTESITECSRKPTALRIVGLSYDKINWVLFRGLNCAHGGRLLNVKPCEAVLKRREGKANACVLDQVNKELHQHAPLFVVTLYELVLIWMHNMTVFHCHILSQSATQKQAISSL